ncbi:SusC/RagA family TonB-linked outer membrane protein [Fodinibius roseus]|nr:SusC/RagA family TonB-linked outer membrane protein [Fodinibius roseus]
MKNNTIGIILLMICFVPVSLMGGQIKKDLAQNNLQMLVDGDKMQVPLEESLDKIEEKFDVNILFRPHQVRGKYVSKRNAFSDSLALELEALLGPLNMTFERVNSKNFIIYDKIEPVLEEAVQEVVTGEITDAESGETLPGVNVLVKGTKAGTSTDSDGTFELTVESLQDTLVFSFVGYQTQEVPIDGQVKIDITMEPQAVTGEEVVVTAFGIERERRQIEYSTQAVDGEDIESVGNSNVVNSLQGKVSGLNVKLTSGEPGASHRITIRSSNSLLGDNEPLYIVDGVPVTGGTRITDLNPSDIKSVNVLKGPGGAALYGLRASQGVIVIETKKGNGTQEPSITFKMNHNFDRISKMPEVQKTYMQGSGGEFDPYSSIAWGPRISDMGTYINQLGEEEVAAAYDNPRDFFQTGGTQNLNLSFSDGFGKGNYIISVGRTAQNGIIPSSGMERNDIRVAGSYDLFDNFNISPSLKYIRNHTYGVPRGPSSDYWGPINAPSSYNLKDKPIHEPGNPYKQINFRGQHDNIYWMIENNSKSNRTARVLGNLNLSYSPIDWLNINYIFGIDNYVNNNKTIFEKGSGPGRTDPPSGGQVINSIGERREINSNFHININKDLSQDLNLSLMFGNEIYDMRENGSSVNGTTLEIGGFHNISNTTEQTTNEYENQQRIVGFFGELVFSWKDAFYLNATGRNDIVSNMPSGNRSFFYPSLGTSIVFTDILSISEEILTYGKLRASIAEVGQPGPLHATEIVLNSGGAVGGFTWPYAGYNAFTQSSAINSSNLETENTQTFEIGTELRFLNNRIGLDYTYYVSNTDGQIYRVPIPLSTGFSSELRNAGKINSKGHEITLNLKPIQSSDFLWDFTTNFSTFSNKVVSLAEGINQLELGSSWRSVIVAETGKEFPQLRGTAFARDPDSGEIVVDNDTGIPLRTPEQVLLGSINPDFEMSFISDFTYKDITFSAQVDWRYGGLLNSTYNRLTRLYGTLVTTVDRESDYTIPGMKGYYEGGELMVEGENDIVIQKDQSYHTALFNIDEADVYEATFVKLREIKLSYQLKNEWLQNFSVESASIYIMGRNIWQSDKVPQFDPEMYNATEGSEYLAYPQIKSAGVGVSINF